jgi:hypothetical protein
VVVEIVLRCKAVLVNKILSHLSAANDFFLPGRYYRPGFELSGKCLLPGHLP